MPTSWLLIAILVMGSLHFLFPVTGIVPQYWNLSGLIFISAGVIVNLMADKAFRQAHTTVRPFEQSTALITGGVFRISRNPMYMGFILILTGVALILRSLSPFLVIFGFGLLMNELYIRIEEKNLARIFGRAWEQYKTKTRRWL
ncbi:MAG: isoprenylcysteine carboxylmethyltransferase family protein [Phycisphaerae bacterium]|nr:isoprenylcysteine carboxylmethyltransferase family protein [Phycisphaerae bacterium]